MAPQYDQSKAADPSGSPHQETLFHLVPISGFGREALSHPQSQPSLSNSRQERDSDSFRGGFEFGYRVPSAARSRTHPPFECRPENDPMLLRDRSRRPSSVKCEPISAQAVPAEEGLEASGYLGQGRSGQFHHIPLKAWKDELVAVKTVPPKGDHEESPALRRDKAEMLKTLKAENHDHIIAVMGDTGLGPDVPERTVSNRESLTTLVKSSFPPLGLRNGDSLPYEHLRKVWGKTCLKVAKHMLSALAYLAAKNIVHRNVKPGSIVYYPAEQEGQSDPGEGPHGGFRFQLAYFGLATYESNESASLCGPIYYQAPELRLESNVHHSHKSDVYSLCATLVAIDDGFLTFHKLAKTPEYLAILHTVQKRIKGDELCEAMGTIDPDERLSAAELLQKHFHKDIATQDAEAPPPSDPSSQTIGPMQNPGRSAAGRKHAPPPLNVLKPLHAVRGRRSGRATPNRISRRATPSPSPRIREEILAELERC
ncbi:hypothetical protein PG994_004029 [Apiospora phragmitis]|uniref:Protein kinase domain-containing protein n=1 Tax=Apiospora phragmitis TaxID=2905665 RepID=A0ABR1VZS8_9PEZI